MPSPPDVILVLSPRVAKLVSFAANELAGTSWFMDFDEDHEFKDSSEAEDAVEALVAEITEQLSSDRADDLTVRIELEPGKPRKPPKTDTARIADRMAKAARKAVEE